MLRAALNYPTEGDRGAVALVVGSVLTFLLVVSEMLAVGAASALFDPAATDAAPTDPASVEVTGGLAVVLLVTGAIVVVLRILLRGYYVAVHRSVVAGDEPAAPAFRGLRLVSDGVISAVVLVTYLVPAAAFGVLGFVLRGNAGLDVGGQVVGTVGAVAFLFAIVAFLAATYLVPAAVTLFAAEDRFLAAYHLRRIVGGAATETYAVGWIEATFIQVFLQPFAYLFQFLLFGVFVRFYLNVSVRYLFASGFADSLDLVDDATASTTVTTTHAATEPGGASPDERGVQGDSEATDGDRPDSLTGDAPPHTVRSDDRWRLHEPGEGDVDQSTDEDDPLADEFYRRRDE